MDGTAFIDALISSKRAATFRLTEGRDIMAVPVAQDGESVVVRRGKSEELSLIYKKAISVITPSGDTNEKRLGSTK